MLRQYKEYIASGKSIDESKSVSAVDSTAQTSTSVNDLNSHDSWKQSLSMNDDQLVGCVPSMTSEGLSKADGNIHADRSQADDIVIAENLDDRTVVDESSENALKVQ